MRPVRAVLSAAPVAGLISRSRRGPAAASGARAAQAPRAARRLRPSLS